MKYHVKPASTPSQKHTLLNIPRSPLFKIIGVSFLFGVTILLAIVGIGYLTSRSLPETSEVPSKVVITQAEPKKVVAEVVPTQMPGCFCFGNNKCYPDGCERKPLQGDTLQWEAICRNDFCGGRPYGMCYDSNSDEVNEHLCLSQPSCCEEMLRHDEPGGRGNPEACCWPERGYCHPSICDQLTRPEQCGWYWQYHAGSSENGYGCTQGTGPNDLSPIYGLPYFLLTTTPAPVNTNTPTTTPTRTPSATHTPTPSPSQTPTGTPTPSPTQTPTPTLTPTQTPTLAITASLSPTPQSAASPTTTTINPLTPGQITSTLAPGQPTSSPAPRCDGSCGICGWKDSAGVCHSTGTVGNTSQACCYHICAAESCTVVSGNGVDTCSSNENCQTHQVTSAPQMNSTLTQTVSQQKPPVSGDGSWMLYLLIPIAIIIGAISL